MVSRFANAYFGSINSGHIIEVFLVTVGSSHLHLVFRRCIFITTADLPETFSLVVALLPVAVFLVGVLAVDTSSLPSSAASSFSQLHILSVRLRPSF